MSALPSTPQRSIDLIRAALRLFSLSFVRALPYALAPIVLLCAVVALTFVVGEDHVEESWALYVMVTVLLLFPALMAPLIYRIHAIAHGRPVTAGQALQRGLRCLLPCVAGAALYMLAVGLGSVLLLLPGLYLLIALSFWWLALVVDGVPTLKALSTSLNLVRGHWWHVAIGYSFIYAVAVGANALNLDTFSLYNEIVEGTVVTLIWILSMTLVPIFMSANMVVLHHDLTLRRQQGDAR